MSSANLIPCMGILAIILITMRPADATIGYNCDTKFHNTATLSLAKINDCNPHENFLKTTVGDIALLELNKIDRVIIQQCKIEIHRVISICGGQSSNSVVSLDYQEYIIHPISRRGCEIAHNHGTMKIGKMIIHGLNPNAITTRNITAGSVDSTGACIGGYYSDPYGTWDNVVVTGKVIITLRSHLVEVEADTDNIELPSGYQCKLSEEQCMDFEGGFTFWKTVPEKHCSVNTYSILYNGTASKLKCEEETVYSIITKDTRFSFSIIGNETSCGATLFKTESPKLFIVESKDLQHLEDTNTTVNRTDKFDIFKYKNDKSLHVEKYIRYPMHYLYGNVMEYNCKREKAILKSILANSSTQPDEFAFQFMGGPGYTAIIEEDKFHILQCVPVEVKLQQQDKCYNRLPILKGNQTLFMTPWTHIITKNATEIPCNSSLSQDHELNSTQNVLLRPVGTPKPRRLKLSTNLKWRYQKLSDLAISGIDTLKNFDELPDTMENPGQVHPAPRKKGFPDANGSTPNRDESVNGQWHDTWNKFTVLTLIFVVLFGIMVFICIMKMIADINHGNILHSVNNAWEPLFKNGQSRKQRPCSQNEVVIEFKK